MGDWRARAMRARMLSALLIVRIGSAGFVRTAPVYRVRPVPGSSASWPSRSPGVTLGSAELPPLPSGQRQPHQRLSAQIVPLPDGSRLDAVKPKAVALVEAARPRIVRHDRQLQKAHA